MSEQYSTSCRRSTGRDSFRREINPFEECPTSIMATRGNCGLIPSPGCADKTAARLNAFMATDFPEPEVPVNISTQLSCNDEPGWYGQIFPSAVRNIIAPSVQGPACRDIGAIPRAHFRGAAAAGAVDSNPVAGTVANTVANGSPVAPSAKELPHRSTDLRNIAEFRRSPSSSRIRAQVANEILNRITASSDPSTSLKIPIASRILPFIVGAANVNSRVNCSFIRTA